MAAVIDHGGQHIRAAEQELLQLAGEHAAGALEHELEQDLHRDDLHRADRAENVAADEFGQIGKVEIGKRGEEGHREAEVHQHEGDGAHHGGHGQTTDLSSAFHRTSS